MAKRKNTPEEPEMSNPWPERLKALREKLNLSNEGMAEKFGVSYRTWLSWIYGARNPGRSAVVLLRRFEEDVGITPD